MWIIVRIKNGTTLTYIGPFNSKRDAQYYARTYPQIVGIPRWYAKLDHCGDAMEYKAPTREEQSRSSLA